MTWWILLFVLYVGGEPQLQVQIFDDMGDCEDARLGMQRQPDVGKVSCWPLGE